jgi:hypothetical protein
MRSLVAGLVFWLVPLSAGASFHLWDITEVYSNADGSVQFVEMFDNGNFENFIGGYSLSSSSTSFLIPGNLGTTATANHHLLFATPAFSSQPGAVPPDFTLPAANFLSTVADTISWAGGVDVFSYGAGELPVNGLDSLNEPFQSNARTSAANSPTNFAGQVGALAVPEPGTAGLVALGLVGLARARVRRRGR